ncbi:hypothetical protein KPL37_17470 [Clostridium frigoris]|uniref:MarR family transcriptional regulator n=1 Tax=Clostridium frigoris TaxID=205327 RepID=A0ABS6BY18_9CLOT|nr:hypothetical protein [Clostridium frigoris]MBU3161499.1 hypothetical protein [Clostridium frigoris]
MLQIERDLIRTQILFELYENLFCICTYRNITRQEYKVLGVKKCEIVAALFYLDDRGFINVRTTSEDDVLIIYIRSRGIDEIELKIKKATTVALTSSFNKLLIPNFDNVPDDC